MATMLRKMAMGTVTFTPAEKAATREKMVMVTAAPSILMVDPSGMDTEYRFSSSPSSLHNSMFTGIFAAELRVKNAVMPLCRRQRNTSG